MINILAKLTGYSGPDAISRLRRLAALAAAAMLLLIISTFVGSGLLYMELISTYTENYNVLAGAGLSDLVASPTVVSDRILLWISLMPLLNAGLVLPTFLLAIKEIVVLSRSHQLIDKDVAGEVDVAKGCADQVAPQPSAVVDQSILLTNHCQVFVEHTEAGSELVLVRVPA